MQALWLEQKYLRPLRLHDGTDVEVVSPGSWNTDAGPDFVNAHIRIGDTEFFGDVELHLNQEGWTQHRHHIDPRYNRVILHVALWSPREVHPIEKEDGSLAPTLILQDLLTIPVKRLLRLLDLD
ncbi:MAG: DUF2851 family protein, partial [Chlamydiia bacterium]|nr:DUF2851 family protein [Chlamydiia bacterium]